MKNLTTDPIVDGYDAIEAIDEQRLEEEALEVRTETQKKYLDVLEKYKTQSKRLDITKPVEQPPVAIALKNVTNDKFVTIGSLGDFSLWTGKSKAGKTYAMRMAVIAALSNSDHLHLGRFKSFLPKSKSVVLYIDTEQSDYHLQLGIKRICKSLNIQNPKNLHVYGFRGTDEVELLQIVEALIYTTKNIGLVIIDGVVDLTNGDINAQADGKIIGTTMLRWTRDMFIHVMAVLHENKSKTDNSAGGALGHWLTKKAECVMNVSVSKDDENIKIVQAIETRNAKPEPFYFSIDENGDAIPAEEPVSFTNNRTRAVKAETLPEGEQTKIVNAVFTIPLNASNSMETLTNYFITSSEYEVLTGAIAMRRYLNYLTAHNYLRKKQGLGSDAKSTFYELTNRSKGLKI